MTIQSIVGEELSALRADGKGVTLAAIAIGWGLLIGTRVIYPVIIPDLQVTYGLSLTAAGLLVTILWLCFAIGQLPSGLLADSHDERTLLVASTIAVAVALVVVVTARTTLVLFIATGLWGLAHSLYPIARITYLSSLYSERLGSALGVTMATGDIGQTILPPVAAGLAGAFAWQLGLGYVTPFLVLAGLFIFFTTPRQTSTQAPRDTRSISSILAVLRQLRTPTMGFIAGISFLYVFIWQSFTAFYPTYLITSKGLSPTLASILYGSFFAVGVVIKPIAGAAYDRIGMRTALTLVLLPPIGGFVLLPFVTSLWLLVGVTILVSVMLGAGPITQPFLAESFTAETQGAGLGVVRTTTATLAASGPVAFGVIGDHGYFDEGYIALAVIMAGVVLLISRIPRPTAHQADRR